MGKAWALPHRPTSSWGLAQKDRLFHKIPESLSPFRAPGRGEGELMQASPPLPLPGTSSPTPAIPPGPQERCLLPRPGGTLLQGSCPCPLTVHLAQPLQGRQRNGCPWAPSPVRRVCGLDEFTLPSIPKYDPIWGRRNPCGCVWMYVNIDTQAAGAGRGPEEPCVPWGAS